MDRRQKIIVSVTGIFIVLLALIGVTYGYFLTRVQGNTNANSLYITTANLKLVYEDDTNEVMLKENIYPVTYVNGVDDTPNDGIDEPIGTKTFTVKNEGDADISEYQVYLENVINTFTKTQDVDLVITCKSTLKNGSTGSCSGYDSDYPTTNAKLISNAIKQGEKHEYTLKVFYYDTGEDQSVDMGKTLAGKIQIYDPRDVVSLSGVITDYASLTGTNYSVEVHSDPKTSQVKSNGSYVIHGLTPGSHTIYVKFKDASGNNKQYTKTISITKGTTASISSDGSSIVITDFSDTATVNITVGSSAITLKGGSVAEGTLFGETLAAKLISNAKSATGTRTVYRETPLSTPIVSASGVNERTLSKTVDVNGPSYYYRGDVQDNYLEFNNMCWRIVRIEGDGSVKLTLAAEKKCSQITSSDIKSAFIQDGRDFAYGTNDVDEAYNSTGGMKDALSDWYTSKGFSSLESKMKNDTWCFGSNDDIVYTEEGEEYTGEDYAAYYLDPNDPYRQRFLRYSAGNRWLTTKITSLMCENEKSITSYIGTLSMDEVALAGASSNTNNNYYLYDNAQDGYWTISLSKHRTGWRGNAIVIYSTGELTDMEIYSGIWDDIYKTTIKTGYFAVRPSITLKSSVIYADGDGTVGDPYKIS